MPQHRGSQTSFAGRLSDKVSGEPGKMFLHRRVFVFPAKIGGKNEQVQSSTGPFKCR